MYVYSNVHARIYTLARAVVKFYLKLGKNSKMRHLYAGQVNNKTSKTQ